jgi:limonene-1,2-epoxide hydrolase
MTSEQIVRRFLDAVHSRDPARVASCFSPEARYANIPHPPASGPDGVEAMLAPILGRAAWVRWDIVSESYGPDRAWLERVDRFWIDGQEYAIECNGVFEVDPERGLITEVRDYVDLGVWRGRLGDVLQRGAR